MTRRPVLIATACAALAASGCGGGGGGGASHGGEKPGGSISGAGATLPQPLYKEWIKAFKSRSGTGVSYDGTGSGLGIAQFTSGTVDFGATDTPMNPAELRAAAKKGRPVHVPTVLGAVAVAYNVPGLGNGLRLDGPTLAGVFLGRIVRWDDPRIRALNPGLRLPPLRISVVHRSDNSGTTHLFTQFLTRTSPEWGRAVGSDKAVRWPVGAGAAKNSGVAAAVARSSGAVGYVAAIYAPQAGLATASLRNRAGAFVAPGVDSTAAAGAGLALPADLRFTAVDQSGDPGAYPITSATFLLVYRDMCKAGRSRNTAQLVDNWLHYALTGGQRLATELDYAPLPDDILAAARAEVAGLVCNGTPLKPRS